MKDLHFDLSGLVTFFSPAGEKKVTKETPFLGGHPFLHSFETKRKQDPNERVLNAFTQRAPTAKKAEATRIKTFEKA